MYLTRIYCKQTSNKSLNAEQISWSFYVFLDTASNLQPVHTIISLYLPCANLTPLISLPAAYPVILITAAKDAKVISPNVIVYFFPGKKSFAMGDLTKYVHRCKNPRRLFHCSIKCGQSCVGSGESELQLASSQTRLETRGAGPWVSLLVAAGV